jgi:hypothetical protein
MIPYQKLQQGLVGAWCPSLGATGLTLLDRSGRGNHAALTNTAGQDNWRASGSGVALNFDGVNDFAATGLRTNYQSGSYSWSWWIRRTGTVAQYPGVIAHTNNLSTTFFLPGTSVLIARSGDAISNRLYVQIHNDTQVSSVSELTAGNDGVLYSYCFAVDRLKSTLSLYKNAELQMSAGLVSPATITRGLEIGRRSASSSGTVFEYAPFMIDDIRIYDRALTLSEIRLLASRRGVGLTSVGPRVILPRSYPIETPPNRIWANDSGVWVPGAIKANTGGAWVNGDTKRNNAGEWE